MKRLFLVAVILLSLMATLMPVVASAAPWRGSKFSSCQSHLSPWSRSQALDVVAAVEAEYLVNAPQDASDELVDDIQWFARHGLICSLNTVVRNRLENPTAYAWYLQVVELAT